MIQALWGFTKETILEATEAEQKLIVHLSRLIKLHLI